MNVEQFNAPSSTGDIVFPLPTLTLTIGKLSAGTAQLITRSTVESDEER